MKILFICLLIVAITINPSCLKIDEIGSTRTNTKIVYYNKQVVHYNEQPSRSKLEDRILIVEATAYTYTGDRTFTGTWPHKGIVAVDPEVIPLNSRLYIENYGFAIAKDTGGLIKGNKIDVFFETIDECKDWGMRNVKVRIIN